MLKILCCVKQVPDVDQMRMDPETGNLIRAGVPAILNPQDANALSAAMSVKETYGGEVTLITMGPPNAEAALRECLAVGADKAVLVTDRAFGNAEEDDMIPAPAQGTLALELRADNAKLMAKLDALSDEKTNLCTGIEREFLKRIGGNCHLPVAAYCDIVSEKDRGNDSNKNNRLKLLAMFGSEDGKQLARTEQVWDMTSDRNDIVERAVHDIRYKLEID